jgi:hypothetical protein
MARNWDPIRDNLGIRDGIILGLNEVKKGMRNIETLAWRNPQIQISNRLFPGSIPIFPKSNSRALTLRAIAGLILASARQLWIMPESSPRVLLLELMCASSLPRWGVWHGGQSGSFLPVCFALIAAQWWRPSSRQWPHWWTYHHTACCSSLTGTHTHRMELPSRWRSDPPRWGHVPQCGEPLRHHLSLAHSPVGDRPQSRRHPHLVTAPESSLSCVCAKKIGDDELNEPRVQSRRVVLLCGRLMRSVHHERKVKITPRVSTKPPMRPAGLGAVRTHERVKLVRPYTACEGWLNYFVAHKSLSPFTFSNFLVFFSNILFTSSS